MALIDKLYLIRVSHQIVSIIPAKDPSEAIDKYIARTGFANIHTYFCSYLMSNTVEIDARNIYNISSMTKAITKTIGCDILSISSNPAADYDDTFGLEGTKDINNPMFIRPTVEEARNCIGFSNEPEYELRKFCI